MTEIGAKKELILAGMGWGGLPEHVVAREQQPVGLVVEAQVTG